MGAAASVQFKGSDQRIFNLAFDSIDEPTLDYFLTSDVRDVSVSLKRTGSSEDGPVRVEVSLLENNQRAPVVRRLSSNVLSVFDPSGRTLSPSGELRERAQDARLRKHETAPAPRRNPKQILRSAIRIAHRFGKKERRGASAGVTIQSMQQVQSRPSTTPPKPTSATNPPIFSTAC